MNGDVLTTLDYSKVIAHHRESGAVLTIATCQKRVKVDFGVIETDSAGNVAAYREKPELDYSVSMGIYIFESRALAGISPGSYLDFPDLVQRLLAGGERVASYLWPGYWLDIGRPEDYEAALQTSHNARLSSILTDWKIPLRRHRNRRGRGRGSLRGHSL